MSDPSPRLLLAAICITEVLGMAAFATFPSLIPVLQPEWNLSNAEAGWISGVYYAGYVAAVPVLVSLTDRMDARRIYLASLGVGAASALGFAISATGVLTASLWRCLQGVGLAGTYMPGLKALTDRMPDRMQSRAIAFYTSSFGIGASLSILLAGEIEAALDWRWAFGLCAIGPAAAFLLTLAVLRPKPLVSAKPRGALLDFRPVLRNRRALGFTLAYMVHNAELFALRSWVVAYLVFSQTQQLADSSSLVRATIVATVVNLMGMPASVLGNELARRFGRPPVILAVMSISAVVGIAVGFGGGLPYAVVIAMVLLFGFMVTADSATITAGVVEVADPARRGATMAVYSMIGFIGSMLGPIVFGLALDVAGGEASGIAWGVAFSVIAAIVMTGPIFVYGLSRDRSRG